MIYMLILPLQRIEFSAEVRFCANSVISSFQLDNACMTNDRYLLPAKACCRLTFKSSLSNLNAKFVPTSKK